MRIMTVREASSAARALIGVAAVVVLGGCATKGDIRALQMEVQAELRAQAARQDTLMMLLQSQAASTQDTLRTQSDQLVDFRGDITRLLRSLSDGMTRLEAIVGENQRGITALRSQAGSGTTAAGPAPPLVDGPGTRPGGSETLAGVGSSANAGQLYQVARDQHNRGSLSAAQQAYEQFLEEFPNDERASAAHFFLADLLEQQGRPDDALERFLEIPSLYPAAVNVPDALFRAARVQLELGDTQDARDTLQRLINTYPDSGLAALAREMLEDLE